MSDIQGMLLETANAVFADRTDARFDEVWEAVDEAGFGILLLDETAGGFGGDWADFFAVMREAGRHALPAPVGEYALATWSATAAGLELPAGCVSVATDVEGDVTGSVFNGVLRRIPWGRYAENIIAVSSGNVMLLPLASASIEEHENPAGEPRDDAILTDVEVVTAKIDVDLQARAGLMRVGQISGAVDSALEMSIEYANSRKQFGRPLAKFQAVQQNLAVFASEAAAVNCAGQAAALACDRDATGDGAQFELAAAKLRVNMAVDKATAIAHQVHGAIGFTEEYPLQRLTRRLMGWRSEFGNDRYWAERLGNHVAGLGGTGLWYSVTGRSD